MPRILCIDDDRTVHVLVRRALKDTDIEVSSCTSAEEALKQVSTDLPDVVLLDVMLPGLSGLEAFKKIQAFDDRLPVIFITASGHSATAIEAMKMGGFDYLTKPLDLDLLETLVNRALESRRLASVPVGMHDILAPDEKGDAFVGRCPAMQSVFKSIGRVAPQVVPVLIRGESGTGKELVARAIFQYSNRSEQPFLAVNCAALSETLLESELFGHEKGAFTGAHDRRIGKFEQCSGGTIFLDEVGDMSPLVQSKVLRLLQEQKFERVGGNETITTDVRIISATNRDLEQMCEEGEFRNDLYYRLNGFTIWIPPLRNRGDDRLLLIQHFLARLNKELNREVQGIAPDALQRMLDYNWPGNVRELQSVVKQSILQSSGPVLLSPHIPAEVSAANKHDDKEHAAIDTHDNDSAGQIGRKVKAALANRTNDLYAEMLAWMETELLTQILKHTDGNQSEASRILGITRGSLRNKIRTLNISIDQVVTVVDDSTGATDDESTD